LGERVTTALGTRLEGAVAAGDVPPGTTSDDLLLAVSMVAGGLSGVGVADRVSRASRAWELLGFAVRIPDAPA
jgi:hypothetical protein